MHHITIAIITHRRPHLLAETLHSLSLLEIPPSTTVRLLVVDNDIEKSAGPVVEEKKSSLPFAIDYEMEETPGIPHARNKVLSLCANADYIAFLDDDDTAEPRWLIELYETVQRFEADVVRGIIRYAFPRDKMHLSVLDIFSNPHAKTGVAVDTAWTNNVLFSTRLFTVMGLRFDAAFTDTGGSDAHFFNCARAKGAKLVMCREAIVHTKVPPERTGLRWLVQRHLRVGATMTMSDVMQHGHWHAAKQVVRAFKDSNLYILRLLPGAFKDWRRIIHPVMVLFFIDGRILGLFQFSPLEYKKETPKPEKAEP